MHWSIKHTFLMFYLRLSPNQTFRRLVWATMVLNTAFMIVNWLLAFLQCIPMDAIFHPERHPDAKCIDKNILLMGPSVLVGGLPTPAIVILAQWYSLCSLWRTSTNQSLVSPLCRT